MSYIEKLHAGDKQELQRKVDEYLRKYPPQTHGTKTGDIYPINTDRRGGGGVMIYMSRTK